MSSLEDRQNQLNQKLSQIDSEIESLDARFLELAAEWNSADGNASMKAAEQIEQRLMLLRREKALLIAGQAHVTKAMLDEKQAAAEAERAARTGECKRITAAIVACNESLDQELRRLREALERRAAHIHALGVLGVNPALTAKLGKPALTRAACYHGLARHIDITRCAPSSLRPLTDTNVLVMGLVPANDSGIGSAHDHPLPGATNGGAEASSDDTLTVSPDELPPTNGPDQVEHE
jgi:NADH dehydrogenase/NADH:ubiquinone oxidoreductase subunit G